MTNLSRKTNTRRRRSIEGGSNAPRTAVAATTAALALVLLAGCGSSGSGAAASTTPARSSSATAAATSSSSASPSATPQAAVTIHIVGFAYKVPASVAPGETVNVMNMDATNHTFTADKGDAFDVKATAGTTTTFVAPTTPGSYPFHCTYHANMHGVLVVR